MTFITNFLLFLGCIAAFAALGGAIAGWLDEIFRARNVRATQEKIRRMDESSTICKS